MTILHGDGGHPDEPTGTASTRMFRHGLIVSCEVSPIEWSVNRLRRAGKQAPDPIRGHYMIDTGSAESFIHDSVVELLNLTVENSIVIDKTARHYSLIAAEPGQPKAYFADMKITINGRDYSFHNHKFVSMSSKVLAEFGLSGVIGRDLLRTCVLVYNGVTGCWTIAF